MKSMISKGISDYIKTNLHYFNLYSLLELIESEKENDLELIRDLDFTSSTYLAQPINEIHSMMNHKDITINCGPTRIFGHEFFLARKTLDPDSFAFAQSVFRFLSHTVQRKSTQKPS